jgi:hypothetical protein
MGVASWCTVLTQNTLFLLPQFQHFLPSSFSGLGQDLQAVLLTDHLTLTYPFNHDYASSVKENDHHCLLLQPAYSRFFHSGWSGCAKKLQDYNENSSLNFTTNFRLMRCLIFILVTNLAQLYSNLTDKPAYIEGRVYCCLLREASFIRSYSYKIPS